MKNRLDGVYKTGYEWEYYGGSILVVPKFPEWETNSALFVS